MPSQQTQDKHILEVTDLKTEFHTQDGTVHAVNGVSFTLNEGEMLGVVGESGSGKSVTMMSLLQLIPMPPGKIVSGQAMFEGRDLINLSQHQIRDVRGGSIGFIFQDPMTSLNPVLTIGRQITEPLQRHLDMPRAEAQRKAIELLKLVGIPMADTRLSNFPHQFSGGMRQRVMIAIALACSPRLLIADEPTTALDVTIQAQIVDLVKRLRTELGMSIIWITHDLGVVAGLVDRVMVMYGGFVVERAEVNSLYETPLHPYTQGLLGSLPRLDSDSNQPLANIKGHPPNLTTPPTSCPFAPRCPYVYDRCLEENPMLQHVSKQHEVACWWDTEKGAPRYDK
ncbi:MAG TPA: ABC transporter ATP-binding protein [Anaerolineae bacterium]|nr:ABC transporter ATP-binding protein [Anaerolineae bacterium]